MVTSKMSMAGWWMVQTMVRPVSATARTTLITMFAALASRPAENLRCQSGPQGSDWEPRQGKAQTSLSNYLLLLRIGFQVAAQNELAGIRGSIKVATLT